MKEEAEGDLQEKRSLCDNGAGVGVMHSDNAGRGTSQDAGNHEKLAKARKWVFPSELSGRTSHVDTLL